MASGNCQLSQEGGTHARDLMEVRRMKGQKGLRLLAQAMKKTISLCKAESLALGKCWETRI